MTLSPRYTLFRFLKYIYKVYVKKQPRIYNYTNKIGNKKIIKWSFAWMLNWSRIIFFVWMRRWLSYWKLQDHVFFIFLIFYFVYAYVRILSLVDLSSFLFLQLCITRWECPCVAAGCDVYTLMESLYDAACLRKTKTIYLSMTKYKNKTLCLLAVWL